MTQDEKMMADYCEFTRGWQYGVQDAVERMGAREREAVQSMLAALKHARRVFGDRNFQSHSENLVWIEIGDAIAEAEAAGIKADG